MGKPTEMQTTTTVRCGNLADQPLRLIQTDEVLLIRIGDLPAFSLKEWHEAGERIIDGLFKLAGR